MTPLRRAGFGAVAGLVSLTVLLLGFPLIHDLSAAGATAFSPGSQGVNPLPAATASQVTVKGAGEYSNFSVTVNQTSDLVNQAIGVSWKGATPTDSGVSNGAPIPFNDTVVDNYVAIFQCWGDPVADPPAGTDPGPPPTQCESGGSALSGANYPTGTPATPALSATRILDYPGQANFATDRATAGTAAAPASVDPESGDLFEPFTAVDGSTVNVSEDPNINPSSVAPGSTFWLNPDFSYYTTNEVPYARTYSDGTGASLFQTDTGLEAPGLGCGQALQPVPGASPKIPKCWLVVVPQSSIYRSPLAPERWAHRIAIPLGFQDVDSPCKLGTTARRVIGNELASPAVLNWQPKLCSTPGDPTYSYTTTSDDAARTALAANTTDNATMAAFTLPPASADQAAVVAPLTISGLTIAFNIQRRAINPNTGEPYETEEPLAGSNVTTVHLTPRLVAKLLTESYLGEFLSFNPSTLPAGADYSWLKGPDHGGANRSNPTDITQDPDFVQFNPEFAQLSTSDGVTGAQLQVELGSADATAELWNWVLSDPEAAAWLSGKPDPWGMQVNPLYSTNAKVNPSGTAFAATTPNQIPKSDPYCIPAQDDALIGGQPVPALGSLNWSPYSLNMAQAALATRTTDIGSKTTPNVNAVDANSYYGSDGRQRSGENFVLSLTDTASAARYGLQTASLSASGDDGPATASGSTAARQFVAPTASAMLAAEQAMTPDSTVPSYLDPSVTTKGVYPLTMVTYASVDPTQLDASGRHDYESFLQYAAGPGQQPGSAFGFLPQGYVPLPATLAGQTRAAVNSIAAAPYPATAAGAAGTAGSTAGGGPSATAALGAGDDGGGASPGSAAGAGPGAGLPGAAVPLHHLNTRKAAKRTPGISVTAWRLALPIALLIGLAAGLAAPVTSRRRWMAAR